MTALTILAIALSIDAIALCVHIDFLHVKEYEATHNSMQQLIEIMDHMIDYTGTLKQRIKKLEEEVKKRENDGRMDKR